MLGRLRWLPEYLFKEDIDNIILAISGYYDELNENRLFEQQVARRQTAILIQPYAKQDYDITKDWPLYGDDANKKSFLLRKLRQHRLSEQQKKQNANTNRS